MAWGEAEKSIISETIQVGITVNSKLPYLANTIFSDEAINSESVKIVNIGPISSQTYVPDTDISWTSGSPTSTTLTCDQWKIIPIKVDDTEILLPDTLNKLSDKASRETALDIDSYVLGKAIKANFPTNWVAESDDSAIEVNSSNILSVFETIKEKMDEANVMDPFICLNSKLMTKLRLAVASQNVSSSLTGDSFYLGQIPQVMGLKIIQSDKYSEITSSDYKILFGSVDAIAAAYKTPSVEIFRLQDQVATGVRIFNRFGAAVTQEELGGAAYLKVIDEA